MRRLVSNRAEKCTAAVKEGPERWISFGMQQGSFIFPEKMARIRCYAKGAANIPAFDRQGLTFFKFVHTSLPWGIKAYGGSQGEDETKKSSRGRQLSTVVVP